MNMKHIYELLLAAGLLLACSDDDAVLTPLAAPAVTNQAATVSSLAFSWSEVEHVSQYYCELSNPDGKVVSGEVTTETSVRFTKLTPNTTYTLNVWAYAPLNSEYESSPAATLTASTPAVVALESPRATVEVSGNTATISWEAVAHAASYTYSYMLGDEEVTETITECSLTLTKLPLGSYRLTLRANSEEEAYSESMPAVVTFTREKMEIWRMDGTYTDGSPAVIVGYDDGSYTIAAWYGVEGYDLECTVDENGALKVLNADPDRLPDIYVATGLDGDQAWMQLRTDGETDGFSGKPSAGSIRFYNVTTGSDEKFTWVGFTIDDLVGTYSMQTAGSEKLSDYNTWTKFGYTADVEFVKVDNNTVTLKDPFWVEYDITGTIDWKARTITFAPQVIGWYLFCRHTPKGESVVATFDENLTIIMNGWTAYYEDYDYRYVKSAKTTYTRK